MKLTFSPRNYFYELIPNSNVKILDIGSLNFSLYKRLIDKKPNNLHYGIDYMDNTEETPTGYIFKKVDLNIENIPFENDTFDFIYASHVIEHLDNPLEFFSEILRILKPNGKIYVEAPSERSLLLKGVTFRFEQFKSFSYYDDPTHTMRPWSPQSFYRLAKYYSAEPIKVGYIDNIYYKILSPLLIPFYRLTKNVTKLEQIIWLANGWCSYLICTKNHSGSKKFKYYIPS